MSHVKRASPFTKGLSQQDRARTAAVAFANTEERLHEKVLGRAAFRRGRDGNFNRAQNTGSHRAAVVADYAGALRGGHTVIPVVHEIFGGWGSRGVRLFRRLARAHADRLDPSRTNWAARSFTAWHAQRISIALHCRSADEILTNAHSAHHERRPRGGRGRGHQHAEPGTRRS